MAQSIEKLNWKQIIQMYPDEWVLLTDYESDVEFDGKGVIAQMGRVIVHAKSRKEFDVKVKKAACKKASITFTGDLVPDGFRGLWEFRK